MDKHLVARLARQISSAIVLAPLACGRGAPARDGAQAPDRAPRAALIAQPCPQLPLGSEPLDPGDARIFVEVAEVTTPGLPRPLGHWLEGRAVEIRSTAHLVAFPDVPTSTPWGLCVDAVCSAMQQSLTLTAHLPERASDPIPLTLRIDQAQASGAAGNALFETTLAVKNQEPGLLPPAPGVSAGSLVVTAYLLRRYDDLQRILLCTAGGGEARPPAAK